MTFDHCPTCGRRIDDELIHSTPLTAPNAALSPEWHADLATLVRLVRQVVLDHERDVAEPRRVDAAIRGRRSQLRKVA